MSGYPKGWRLPFVQTDTRICVGPGDLCHLPGDVWHHIALRWWICPLVPPDTCATIRCLTLEDWQMLESYVFWGVGYKTHHDIRSRRRNSWKSLTGTMSLYHSMAFSDLEVCFLRLNFWWSCINRYHQDDSPIFVRNKKTVSHFSKDTGQEEGEFSLSNRPSQKSTFLVASSICRMVVLWWSRSTTWRPGFRWSVFSLRLCRPCEAKTSSFSNNEMSFWFL